MAPRDGARRRSPASAAVVAAFLVAVLGELASSASPLFAVVTGSSMRPALSPGDAVLLVRGTDYSVGDVVAYRDPVLRLVIHRIVDVEADRFVTAGDANAWLDSYRPAAGEIAGRLAVSMPAVGAAVRLVRQPIVAGGLAAGLVLMLGMPLRRRSVLIVSCSLLGGVCLAWAARGALAAGNAVPESGAAEASVAITANALRPPECADLAPTALVVGSGTVTGTTASELILGAVGPDVIRGEPDAAVAAGSDCVLAGGGDDEINGDTAISLAIGGNDVLVGGPGNDRLDGGPGSDVCHAAGGVDTFTACEVQTP